MQEKIKELCRIRGIGEVLAGRLIETGLDSYAKIAAAGAEGLAGIRGMVPRSVPAILAQAAELAAPLSAAPDAQADAGVREAVECLRQKVEVLAAAVRERRFADEPDAGAQKVEKQIRKLIGLLDRIAANPDRRPKKTGRRLIKADCRLSGVENLESAGLVRELKKTRRKLGKAIK